MHCTVLVYIAIAAFSASCCTYGRTPQFTNQKDKSSDLRDEPAQSSLSYRILYARESATQFMCTTKRISVFCMITYLLREKRLKVMRLHALASRPEIAFDAADSLCFLA